MFIYNFQQLPMQQKSLFNALKGIIKASIIPAKLSIKKLWKNFLFIYVFLV